MSYFFIVILFALIIFLIYFYFVLSRELNDTIEDISVEIAELENKSKNFEKIIFDIDKKINNVNITKIKEGS